ncbi:hypothetical protein UA75_11635 [Actinoalloteichus sp. GBA129-24]|uniref:Uncharacterized protein n=1 Tax=Actinoalloteichus fjordicus TaxID=1612552 RepID=A0AAC9LCK5_9PSEU|nr:hypothetical protein UA74_11550 [Actinoalloteichus fjordicus]APU20339.1 hypothetical protein UA75_11635 [Actinoalloteichus sp. GBA129-24]
MSDQSSNPRHGKAADIVDWSDRAVVAIRATDTDQLRRVVTEVLDADRLTALLRHWTDTIVRFARHDENGGVRVPAPPNPAPNRELWMHAVGELFDATVAGDEPAARRICSGITAWSGADQEALTETFARVVSSAISPFAVPSHYVMLTQWLSTGARGEYDERLIRDMALVVTRMWLEDGTPGATAAGALLTSPERLREAVTLLARTLGSRLAPGAKVVTRVVGVDAADHSGDLDAATEDPSTVEDPRRRALLFAGRSVRDMANGEPDRVAADLASIGDDREMLGIVVLSLAYMFRTTILRMAPDMGPMRG